MCRTLTSTYVVFIMVYYLYFTPQMGISCLAYMTGWGMGAVCLCVCVYARARYTVRGCECVCAREAVCLRVYVNTVKHETLTSISKINS